MQPNTEKYFPFLKIAFLENIYFPENILHEPNTALGEKTINAITPTKIKLLNYPAKGGE